MNWFMFILTRSFKNSILKVLRKPASLIGYLFLIGMFSLNFFNTSRNLPTSTGIYPKIIYLLIVLIIAYFSIVVPVYTGTKKFRLRYLPADGIYLMAAPLKPLTILWYAQIKQSLLIIVMSVFMVIQIPVLVNSVGLSFWGIMIFLFAYAVITFVPNVICLCAFTLGLKSDVYKQITRYISLIIGAGGGIVLFLEYIQSPSLLEGIENGLMSDLWIFVPIIGWCYLLFVASVVGTMTTYGLISLFLLSVTVLMAFIVISKTTDEQFYEEALNTASLISEMKEGMKQGKTQLEVSRLGKKVKARKIKIAFKREGVFALFDKQRLMTRKKGIGFFDFQTLLVVALIVTPMYYIQRIAEAKSYSILIAMGIASYALFFIQLVKGQTEDLERHYIYMLPYHGILKLLSISLWSFLKLLVDATIGFTFAAILTRVSIVDSLLAALFIALLGYLFYLDSILATIIFGKTGTLVLRMMVRVFFYLVFVISVVIILAVIIQDNIATRQALGIAVADLVMIGFCVLMMIPASMIVKKPEFNS